MAGAVAEEVNYIHDAVTNPLFIAVSVGTKRKEKALQKSLGTDLRTE